MYWFLNKKTDEPMVFGSLPVLSKYLGYAKNDRTLSIHFSEKKKKNLITEDYRIERIELIRSERAVKIKVKDIENNTIK